jgi:beta-N-acetylhexosaminidase
VQCLKAGTDILLHPLDADLMVKELLCAVECGEITEEQIDEAVNRILKKKAKIHNKTTPLSPPLLRGELKGGEVDYQSHRILSSQITERSITLVKCVTGLPVMDGNEIALILAGDNSLFKSSPLKVLSKNVSTITSLIPLPQAQGLKGRVKNVFSERILIFAIFTSVAAGRGASGIDDEERDRISELIKRAETSIVISFGCPYVLQSFGGANMLIAAYDATEQAQRSVIKCLQGEMDFKGRLPVKLSC